MASSPRIAFFPGAIGSSEFWRPVAERLPETWEKTLFSWPGAGEEAHDPGLHSFDDLVDFAARDLAERTDIVAQSLGGVVAVTLALRQPAKVRRLVLVASPGGIDVSGLGAGDWRELYRAEYPNAARWITDELPDYSGEIDSLTAPTLLLWGAADPISPPAVGERLARLLPDATLHVLDGGAHWLAREQPDAVAGLVAAHLE